MLPCYSIEYMKCDHMKNVFWNKCSICAFSSSLSPLPPSPLSLFFSIFALFLFLCKIFSFYLAHFLGTSFPFINELQAKNKTRNERPFLYILVSILVSAFFHFSSCHHTFLSFLLWFLCWMNWTFATTLNVYNLIEANYFSFLFSFTDNCPFFFILLHSFVFWIISDPDSIVREKKIDWWKQ